jgi:hypothetical protein
VTFRGVPQILVEISLLEAGREFGYRLRVMRDDDKGEVIFAKANGPIIMSFLAELLQIADDILADPQYLLEDLNELLQSPSFGTDSFFGIYFSRIYEKLTNLGFELFFSDGRYYILSHII